MSADNGIYILQTKDGYRVTHAQAIDNLYWWPDEGKEGGLNPQIVYDYFHDSKVFATEAAALSEAAKMNHEIMEDGMPLEYGICPIHGMENKDFPTEGTKEQ